MMRAQQSFDLSGRTITNTQPDELGRKSMQRAQIAKIGVFGDNDKTMPARVIPDLVIGHRPEAERVYVIGIGKNIGQTIDDMRR